MGEHSMPLTLLYITPENISLVYSNNLQTTHNNVSNAVGLLKEFYAAQASTKDTSCHANNTECLMRSVYHGRRRKMIPFHRNM